MSDSYKEQYPLLCEEASDEESQNSRRFRNPPCHGGRARTHAKGATVIITQWTDHWSKSVTCWWAVIGMFLITTFLVYNAVAAFALLPPTHTRPFKTRIMNKIENTSNRPLSPRDVYLHILVNNKEEVDLNKYLPYVEELSNKYPDFNYHFIIVFNNSHIDQKPLSAEELNEIAFNSLWSKKKVFEKPEVLNHNIDVHRISLTDYMDRSPLKKDWRHLPDNFIEFLLRAVSIWDKGGVALHPAILTPLTSHKMYTEKLHNILDKIIKCNENKTNELKKKHLAKPKEKSKKRVNNIRDIIEILEHDDSSFNSPSSLSEAEDKISSTVTHSGRKLLSVTSHGTDNLPRTDLSNDLKVHMKKRSTTEHNKLDRNKTSEEVEDSNAIQNYLPFYPFMQNNKSSHFSILPLFFDFLFHDETKQNIHKVEEEVVTDNISRQRKSVTPLDTGKNNASSFLIEAQNNTKNKLKPVSAKGLVLDDATNHNISSNIPITCEIDELSIDLKGNIIATGTPCHAFVGTIFSNVIHHAGQNSLNDFIIQELSFFCNGLLSSCKGIDLILL